MARCVLVTGASGGIGAAIARAFAAAGDRVALGCFATPQSATALCEELRQSGAEAMVCRADVRSAAAVEAMYADIEQAFGPVQVLVNNAGTAGQMLFQDIPEAVWDDMMGVNVKGAYLCTKRALPAMLRAQGGCVLNVSSMWGQVGASCEVHYSTAKAALVGMTKALAKEVGPSGVRVNCIAPGAVETAMLAGFGEADRAALCEETPLGRLGTPQDIAAAALYLCGEGAAFITGQVLGVNGGMVV